MIYSIVQLLFVIISPILWYALGRFALCSAYDLIALLFKRSDLFKDKHFSVNQIPAANIFVFGLLLYLLTALAFFSLGVPIGLASCLALIPGLVFLPDMQINISWQGFKPSVNFALWFTVIFALGLSLFSAVSDITTPWANNYGDITFHFGMISSFVFGENSIPEYPIFPGQILSYHFLINFWSACLWWINPNFFSLSLIFAFQWLLAWILVYWALEGEKFKVLPWVVLFAGGSYVYVFGSIQALVSSGTDKWAHEFISQGMPWTPLISTIWVPQRPAILGLLLTLPCLKLFHDFINSGCQRSKLIIAVLTLSLAALAHTTFFLTLSAYVFLVLLLRALSRIQVRPKLNFDLNFRVALLDLLLALLAFMPALLTFPWLMGKLAVVSLKWGWMPWPDTQKAFLSIFNSISMWLDNAPIWILVLILLLAFCRIKIPVLAIGSLFILGSFIQLGVWNWDHIKFFIALYLITISLIAHIKHIHPRLISFFVCLMIVPALYETVKVLILYREHTVYTKEALELADEIRYYTEPRAVIAASPKHNSVVTLTGRRMFSGYGGTLHSHAIAYEQRRDFASDLSRLVKCNIDRADLLPGIGICPQYLLWTKLEEEEWKGAFPSIENEVNAVIPGALYSLP